MTDLDISYCGNNEIDKASLPLRSLYSSKRAIGFPGGSDGKESTRSARDPGSIPGLGRFPWRREQQSSPVFLPGESHGQRNLAGCSLWGCTESDTTERLTLSLSRELS